MPLQIEKVELNVGMHLLGHNTSIHAKAKDIILEFHDKGILCHSSKTKRSVLIPFSNIKGIEVKHDSSIFTKLAADKAPKK